MQKNIYLRDRITIAFLLVLLISFVLSVWGIWYGLPDHVIGDEESLIFGALKMLELKTLVPSLHPAEFEFLYYPVVIPYLVIAFSTPVTFWQLMTLGSLQAVKDFFILNQGAIWIAARMVSVVASVAMLVLLYRIASLVFTKRIALLSVVLLAASFLHMNAAHFARHWMMATLASYFVAYGALRFVKQKDVPWWLVPVSAAVALGVSYTAVLGALFAACYFWSQRKHIQDFTPFAIRSCVIFLILGAGIVGLHYGEALEIIGPLGGRDTSLGLASTLTYGISVLARQEILISLAAVAALCAVKKYGKLNALIFSLALIYLIIVHFAYHIEVRYLYFIVPLLAMAAATFWDYCIERKWRVEIILLTLGTLYSFAVVMYYDVLLTRKDTRAQAREWIFERQDTEFILSSPAIQLYRTKDALERELRYGRVRFAERYLLAHERLQGRAPAYRYTNLHFWNPDKTVSDLNEYLKDVRPRYFVVEYWSGGNISQLAKSLMTRGRLVAEFRQSDQGRPYDINGNFFASNVIVFSLARLGPTVQVYELP